MTIMVTVSTAIIGSNGLTTVSIGILAIAQAVNRQLPTGGVAKPSAILVSTRMPKWIGSTPRAAAIGVRIGIRMRIAGVVSMNMPMMKNRICTRSRKTMVLSVR